MIKKIIVSVFNLMAQLSVSFFRILLIGCLTVAFLILNVNELTDSDYGVTNLVIIASSFAFFPTFFVLLTEIFLYERRKNRKKSKEEEKLLSASDL